MHDCKLIPLSISDKPLFEEAISRLSEPISDYSFANIYIWKDIYHLTWANIHNHLCIFANGTGLTLFIPPFPLSEPNEEELKNCLNCCFKIIDNYHVMNCLDVSLGRIHYANKELLDYLCLGTTGLVAENFSGDYIYDKKEMINLPGGLFKKKRQSKQKFMRLYPNNRVEALNKLHLSDCLHLLDDWQRHANETKKNQITEGNEIFMTCELRSMEAEACRQALMNFSELDLRGMVLYVGNILVGFTLGEKIGKSQASILFEKTHPDYDGAPQFIFSEFCRLFWDDCEEINAGDDWFIPTLRSTKESYHPKRRLNKYLLVRQKEEVILRKASLGDLERLAEIESRCFEPGVALNKEKIRKMIQNPRIVNLVACCGDVVVGWAVSFSRKHIRSPSGRVYNLAVDPEYHSKGIGRKLLTFLIKRFELLGFAKVYLEVDTLNEKAIRIYRAFGFKEHHKLQDYYGKGKNGMSMCFNLSSDN